jgi:hypothetical protein
MQITDKRVKNLISCRFGKWIVLDYAGIDGGGSKVNVHKWLCRCDCGVEVPVNGKNLKSGLSLSCRHCRFNDITGQKFGKLTVINFVRKNKDGPLWECACDCGGKRITTTHSLNRKASTSCGCMAGKHMIKHGLSKDPVAYRKYLMQFPFRRLRSRVSISVCKALRINGGSKNGCSVWTHLSYTPEELRVHLENLWEPWMNWDNYGGKPNDVKQTWWIDHIIPQTAFQYTSMDSDDFTNCWSLDNLRPLEKMANIIKGTKHG